MSIKHFVKNFIVENDEDIIKMTPDEYLEVLDDVGGIAERVYRVYKKPIIVTGDLNVSKYKN